MAKKSKTDQKSAKTKTKKAEQEEAVVENVTVEEEAPELENEAAEEDFEIAEEDSRLAETEAQLLKVQQELEEQKGQYARLMAEFDNFRKRTRRETEDFRKYASEEVLKALLPVLDNFSRTLTALETTDNLTSLKEGITLVSTNMSNVLKNKGLSPMESKGEKFDLDLHEAIGSFAVEEEEKKGTVLEEVEKGYKLHDKVIRYAKVIVGE